MNEIRPFSPTLLVVTASASSTSRSEKLGRYVVSLLKQDYAQVDILDLRTLPPAALLSADVNDHEIAGATRLVANADAIVFVTPTYKGAYTGLLKVFIDLLPQYALKGKIVLPLATGGTIAHVQMLDHCLRPVLQTMWPRHVTQGCFVLDQHIEVGEGERVRLAEEGAPLLLQVIELFEAAITAFGFQERDQAA